MEDGIDILHYYRIFKKHVGMIVLMVFLVTGSAIGVSLMLPNTYLSTAVIMPYSQAGGDRWSALTSSVGFIPQIGQAYNASASTKLLVILGSRQFTERIIDRLNLTKVFYEKMWDYKQNAWMEKDPKRQPTIESAVARFGEVVHFVDDKKMGIIKILVELEDKELAAQVANVIMEELRLMLDRNAYTLAKKNRLFIEEQLLTVERELLLSGKELSDYYRNNEISSANPNINVSLSYLNGWSKMAGNTTSLGNDTQVRAVSEGIAKLRHDEKALAQNRVHEIPQQIYLEYLNFRKQILGQVSGLLHNQYEIAKIEEDKEDMGFEIVDYAYVPQRKYKPQRRMIVTAAFFSGMLLAVPYIVLMEYVESMRKRRVVN